MVVVQIGANKGYDDLTEILKDKEVHMLILVEPFSELNESLKNCYSHVNNLFIENVIISNDENKTSSSIFYHVDDSTHENRFELASLHRAHSLKIRPQYTLDGIAERVVPSTTINKLLKKYGLINIDILFIDTEGFDDKIIENICFDSFNIKEIYYENLHIDVNKTRNFLKDKGYIITTNVGFGGWSDLAKTEENVVRTLKSVKNEQKEKNFGMVKLNHFFQKIDGWSELERQGVLLQKILGEIETNEKINIAEIGVYKGRGTAMWNVILINQNIEYDYYAIDNFLGSSEHQKNVNYYEISIENLNPIIDRIKIIKNDSLEESKKYDDNFFDIVYIDGAHDYVSVSSDIKHWFPKVKEGGFICGDDYTDIWPDVKKSVEDFFGNNFHVIGQTQWLSKK